MLFAALKLLLLLGIHEGKESYPPTITTSFINALMPPQLLLLVPSLAKMRYKRFPPKQNNQSFKPKKRKRLQRYITQPLPTPQMLR